MLNFAKPVEFSAEPDMYKRSIFPAWCSQHYKMKQNAKTVLVRLAFPINAHQNAKASRKCAFILGAVYSSTPADVPDPPFQFFEGLVPRLQAHHPLICLFVSEGLVFCSPDMSMAVNWGMHDLGYWMLTSIFWAMVLHYTPPDLG